MIYHQLQRDTAGGVKKLVTSVERPLEDPGVLRSLYLRLSHQVYVCRDPREGDIDESSPSVGIIQIATER